MCLSLAFRAMVGEEIGLCIPRYVDVKNARENAVHATRTPVGGWTTLVVTRAFVDPQNSEASQAIRKKLKSKGTTSCSKLKRKTECGPPSTTTNIGDLSCWLLNALVAASNL